MGKGARTNQACKPFSQFSQVMKRKYLYPSEYNRKRRNDIMVSALDSRSSGSG